MNQSGPEAYFSHFHIREILDHFVSTYVQREETIKETANRAYLLKNISTDAENVDTSGDKDEEEDYAAIHPQLKAIVRLRKYLETYQSEERAFKKRHPYVIFVSSELNLGETGGTSPATTAMMRMAQRLAEDTTVEAEIYTPQPMAQSDISGFSVDSPESRKLMDHFRVKKAGEIGGILNQKEKSITIFLVREWPRAVADTLAVEDVLGRPQFVIHFSHPQDQLEEDGGFECNPGDVRTIQDISRRVHTVAVEAGHFNPPRERAALLGYYAGTKSLFTVEVDDSGEPLTPALVDLLLQRIRECHEGLKSI